MTPEQIAAAEDAALAKLEALGPADMFLRGTDMPALQHILSTGVDGLYEKVAENFKLPPLLILTLMEVAVTAQILEYWENVNAKIDSSEAPDMCNVIRAVLKERGLSEDAVESIKYLDNGVMVKLSSEQPNPEEFQEQVKAVLEKIRAGHDRKEP